MTRRLAYGTAVVVLLASCAPGDDDPLDESEAAAASIASDVAGLEAAAASAVEEWDAEAVLTELQAEFDDEGAVESAQLAFTGPGASSVLVVDVAADSVESSTVTLETLGLEPVPGDALEAVPALEALEPEDVAEQGAEALRDCGYSDPREVRYISGAPEGWDGSAWRAAPMWTVTLFGDGGGVVFDDPASVPGDGGACVEVDVDAGE